MLFGAANSSRKRSQPVQNNEQKLYCEVIIPISISYRISITEYFATHITRVLERAIGWDPIAHDRPQVPQPGHDATAGCAGLANRLFGVAAAFLYAVLSRRAFLIRWPLPAAPSPHTSPGPAAREQADGTRGDPGPAVAETAAAEDRQGLAAFFGCVDVGVDHQR
jgi:hypothetical protein